MFKRVMHIQKSLSGIYHRIEKMFQINLATFITKNLNWDSVVLLQKTKPIWTS